jgi:hypothetical protein
VVSVFAAVIFAFNADTQLEQADAPLLAVLF